MRSTTALADGEAADLFAQPVTDMPGERLEHEMSLLAGHLAAATARFLELVGEYDERRIWSDWECLSCAHWLSFRCGVSLHAAREQVRVARCLRRLPLIAATFARGELSYSKVRAITRVANLESQSAWIDLARAATATILDTAVSRFRRWGGTTIDESLLSGDEDSSHRRRSMRWSFEDGGDIVARIRIPAGDAALFRDAITSALVAKAPDGERLDSYDSRLADALFDRVVAGASVDESLSEPPRVTVHLTVPIDAVPGGAVPDAPATAEPDSEDRLAFGKRAGCACTAEQTAEQLAQQVTRQTLGSLGAKRWPVSDGADHVRSFAWLRGLLDEASVQFVLDVIDGETAKLLTQLDLGRSARMPNRALRRSVMRRDGGTCRFPGCSRRHRLNIHHIVFWEHGGATDLENLIVLCPAHHAAIHRRGWSITGTASTATFVSPEGSIVSPESPALGGTLAALVDQHAAHGIDITADGAGSLWAGDHIDWDCFFAAFSYGPLAAQPPMLDQIRLEARAAAAVGAGAEGAPGN